MVITGYQGIGKSTLASKNKDIIDLESTCFWRNENGFKTRPDDWYVYYCQIALDLSKHGYTVFVSCHPKVREFLEKHHGMEKFCLIFPSKSIKNEWIARLKERYDSTKEEKDLNALSRAVEHFDEDIDRLFYECSYGIEWYSNAIKIEDINYDLQEIVNRL